MLEPAGLKYRSQVTGQVTGHRSRSQVTGHRSQVTGHRSQGKILVNLRGFVFGWYLFISSFFNLIFSIHPY